MNLCKHIIPIQLLLLLWTLSVTGIIVTNIRLVNTITFSEFWTGRLEIQTSNNPVWGAVCDDDFDNRDAGVACRMLGFQYGGVVTFQFGMNRNLEFMLDDTACKGNEQNLTHCICSMTHDCHITLDQQVGIECLQAPPVTQTIPPVFPTTPFIRTTCQSSNPTVQIVGNVSGMGLVRVRNPVTGVWGFVCDDCWDEYAARVVCGQLCYPVSYKAKPGVPAESLVIPSNPNIILDDLRCTGNENTIQDCARANWDVNNCLRGSGELAGVQCVPVIPNPKTPELILECTERLMIASFPRTSNPTLEMKHLSVLSGACPDAVKSQTAGNVTITIPLDKCNTSLKTNGTHIVFSNLISYAITDVQDTIIRGNDYSIRLTCCIPNNDTIITRLEPIPEIIRKKTTTNFQCKLEVYRNDTFDNPETVFPVQVSTGEFVNIAVHINQTDPRLQLIVPKCIATPNPSMQGTNRKDLFVDKCIAEQTLSYYPLNKFKFGFRFQTFKFVGFPCVYIMCDCYVCPFPSTSRECDRTCNNIKPATITGRKKRSSDVMHQSHVSSTPIFLYDPHSHDDGLESGIEDIETDLTVESDFKVIIDNDDAPTPVPTTASTLDQNDIERSESSSSSFSPPSFDQNAEARNSDEKKQLDKAHGTEVLNEEDKEDEDEKGGEKQKLMMDGSGFARIKYSINALLILLLFSRTFI